MGSNGTLCLLLIAFGSSVLLYVEWSKVSSAAFLLMLALSLAFWMGLQVVILQLFVSFGSVSRLLTTTVLPFGLLRSSRVYRLQ